jgi:outer membrane protein OmpA-like peptidoglycan-associated protein
MQAIEKRGTWLAPTIALLAFCAARSGSAQSLADRLKGVQSGHEGADSQVALPAWKPVTSATSSMTIPLIKGLVVAGAQTGDQGGGFRGDREQIRTIKDATATAVTLVVEWDTPNGTTPNGTTASGGKPSTKPPERRLSTRVVNAADLAASHRFMIYFHIGETEHYPGATGFGASAEVVKQLRAAQPSEFDFEANPNPLAMMMGDQSHTVAWNGFPMNQCTLHRVGTTDVSIPMLVNGVRVELPVIHAMCPCGKGDEAHFYFLDQPSNPLLLDFAYSGARSQMIKIDFPVNSQASVSTMEQTLASKKPVQIYGIYFDFNSATMKPESEAVLTQISDILRKNPDWKLSVSGHTDNIGEASLNQSLSERRAAAVKNELVTRYNISPGRLTTEGYGASRPIETNSTVEGRARNRRVELQRE